MLQNSPYSRGHMITDIWILNTRGSDARIKHLHLIVYLVK